MDGAVETEEKGLSVLAKTEKEVRQLADKILPPHPHHLTAHMYRKYPVPDAFFFTGPSERLQYMTYFSDADRGFLTTVPSYEIMDSPEHAAPVKTVVRPEARKKMSIKDYQNRKKSNSPNGTTGTDPSAGAQEKQGAGTDTVAPTQKEENKTGHDTEQRTKEIAGAQIHVGTGVRRPEQNADRDRSQAQPQPTTDTAPENQKRQPEATDALPLPKKQRTEAPANSSQSRDPKPDASLDRNRVQEKDTLNKPRTGKEPVPSGATNSRIQVVTNDKDRSSPRSTLLLNGGRSRAGSSTSTPRKGDKGEVYHKSTIPPLLSPLRGPASIPPLLSPLRLDAFEDADGPRRAQVPAGKAPSKGPPKTGNHFRSVSTTKISDTPEKKAQDKPGFKISRDKESQPTSKAAKRRNVPPLLSPTLPPQVEAELAELARRRRTAEPGNRDSVTDASEPSLVAKKTEAPVATRDDIDEHRESKIVTVKYKKSLKPRMQQLEKLLASSTPKGSERSDRSASVDRPPAPAKKRPPPTAEANSEPGPKKSRLSTGQAASSKPRIAAPTTPLKNSTGTAMRRVLSNTSQANTPGDTTGLTPGAAERPSTSSDSSTHVVDPAVAARNRALRNRSDEFTRLGTKLKRAKDAIVGKPPRPMSGPEEKRAAALHFEMILAYMIAFKALNDGTPVGHPSLSFQAWESLLPHFVELRNRFRSWRPLHALAIQVQAVILEEITKCISMVS